VFESVSSHRKVNKKNKIKDTEKHEKERWRGKSKDGKRKKDIMVDRWNCSNLGPETGYPD
jgi:hypothetical protein